MRGDPELFARQDAIEAAGAWWIRCDAVDAQHYDSGSWGPPGAERLAADIGGWRAPSPLAAPPAGASQSPQPTPQSLAEEITIAN
jgi:glucose-6-phosphate 1-dehydrogenase